MRRLSPPWKLDGLPLNRDVLGPWPILRKNADVLFDGPVVLRRILLAPTLPREYLTLILGDQINYIQNSHE